MSTVNVAVDSEGFTSVAVTVIFTPPPTTEIFAFAVAFKTWSAKLALAPCLSVGGGRPDVPSAPMMDEYLSSMDAPMMTCGHGLHCGPGFESTHGSAVSVCDAACTVAFNPILNVCAILAAY